MRKKILLAIMLAGVMGAWAGWSVRAFLAVDACMDAGGAWEGRGSYCYGVRPAGE